MTSSRSRDTAADFARQVREGSPRALARLITWLENDDDRATACMEILYPHAGGAYVLGITGSPGAGKSSLTDKLIDHFRRQNHKVGIIAVDPTSPFTGGALLGDRVRMSQHALDEGVFIRSMATRGFLGGLAQATEGVIKAMDAAGLQIILIETVGVGQDEVDVVRIADTVCLVLVPGFGDVIQSMKAGVMEIADIYAVNKADLAGADQLFTEITARVAQDGQLAAQPWTPPVVKTVGTDKKSITDLTDAIEAHRRFLGQSGELTERRRQRVRQETLQMIHQELFRILRQHLAQSRRIDAIVDQIMEKKQNPYRVMRQVIAEFLGQP